jgi:hypothetical protein
MAIKVAGTTVIDSSRNLTNIGTFNSLTYPTTDGTVGQLLKTNGSGTLSFFTLPPSGSQGFVTQYTGGNAPPGSFANSSSIALI